MANNVTLPGTGETIGTEDIAGVEYQLIKLVDGTAAGTGRIGGDATNGLDVDVTRLPALVAGTALVGKVNVLGDQPAATVGTIGSAAATVQGTVTSYAAVSITVSGTHAGINLTFEVSDDSGTTWFPYQFQREADGAIVNTTGVLATNGATMYTASTPGITTVRVRATAWTSGGTNSVRISPGSMPLEPVVSTINRAAGTAGAMTSVASTVTANTTLIAADAARVGLTIFNESTSVLWILLGAGTESTTVYTLKIPAAGYYECPDGFASLRVSGHWTAANGSARITALT